MSSLDLSLSAAPAAVRPRALWTARETVVAHAALLLLATAAYACWIAAGATVPWDSKNHFYPMFRFLADSLARGEAPLWNPYHFGGHPTVADPQSLLFTPTMALFAWLAPRASMQAFDAAILAHLVAGGFAVIAMFRRSGWAVEGAVLAAMVFVLGGSASARLQHTGMVISYAMLPIALASLEAALAEKSLWRGAAFGVAGALMALGRDQTAFLGCVTLLCALAWRAADAPSPWRYLRERLGVLAVAGLVGAAIMVVPTLLTLQLLATSNRPGIPYGVAATGSLSWVNFATLFAPNVFGSLNWDYSYFGPGYETSAEPDWTDRNVNYLFIGLVPSIMFVWHGLAGRRLFERDACFFAFVALFAAIYAVGRATPLFQLAFDRMPGVSLYRRPADATFLLNFALAMGAGYAMHRFVRDGAPRFDVRGWRALAPVATVAALIAAAIGALAFAAGQGHALDAAAQLLAPFIGAAALIAAMRYAPQIGLGRALAIALVVFAGGELVLRNAASSLNAEPVSRYSIYAAPTAEERAALAALEADIALRGEAGQRPRVEIVGLSGPWMNASMTLRLEDTIGYNPLRLADYQRAVGPGENAGDLNLRQFPETFRGWRCRLASLLGLEYLVLDRPLSELPRHIPRPKSARAIFSGEKMHVYRLGAATPRAFLARRVAPVDTAAALERRATPDFDKASEALIDASDYATLSPALRSGASGAGQAGEATVLSYANDRVTIDVDARETGLLVLHDLHYPGWTARVDGQEQPVLRANLLFRGVEVTPGRHRVEFTFRPFSLANLGAAARTLTGRP